MLGNAVMSVAARCNRPSADCHAIGLSWCADDRHSLCWWYRRASLGFLGTAGPVQGRPVGSTFQIPCRALHSKCSDNPVTAFDRWIICIDLPYSQSEPELIDQNDFQHGDADGW